jgi:Zn-dependent protease/CBS domain-containing protein
MDGSLRIGRLFEIPILIHFTFLLIIPVIAWIVAVQIGSLASELSQTFRLPIDTTIVASGAMPYILGMILALGLFAGVLVHELAHSLVAKRNGIKINSITLLIFGGVAMMDEGVPDPKTELPMALVGPLASLMIGILCSGLAYVSAAVVHDSAVAGVFVFLFGYLGFLNIILFVFNLLPAFPMDGGRVLRAWLAQRMPLPRATKIAADIGKVFAVLFAIVALIPPYFNPLLLLIAFFIYIGAGQETVAVRYNVLLQDIQVGSIMSRPVMTVEPTLPVMKVVEMMYATKHLGFPVLDRNVLVGMVTVADVQKRSVIDRDAMQVRDVMSRDVIAVTPDTPVTDVLRIMSARNIGRVPVVENGVLAGIVTRTDILKVIELRDI